MKKLIIIDGICGVGKTTVANYICDTLKEEYICIDPDEKYNSDPVSIFLKGKGPIPQNTIIKSYLRTEVKRSIQDKNIIIPVYLTSEEFTKDWIDCFQDIADVKYVFLYADKETLKSRINEDAESRDKSHAVYCLETHRAYHKDIEGSIIIDTSRLSPDAVAREILDQI